MEIPESDWPCPFCGAKAGVSSVSHPETGQIEPVVIHAIPYCSAFENMDATDFLSAAVDKYTGRDKGTN